MKARSALKNILLRKAVRIGLRVIFGAGEGVLLNVLAWKLTASGRVDTNELFRSWLTLVTVTLVVAHICYENLIAEELDAGVGANYASGLMNQIQPELVKHLKQKLQTDGVAVMVDNVVQTQKAFNLPPQQDS